MSSGAHTGSEESSSAVGETLSVSKALPSIARWQSEAALVAMIALWIAPPSTQEPLEKDHVHWVWLQVIQYHMFWICKGIWCIFTVWEGWQCKNYYPKAEWARLEMTDPSWRLSWSSIGMDKNSWIFDSIAVEFWYDNDQPVYLSLVCTQNAELW